MEEKRDTENQFQEWAISRYKRNVAFQLNKALECANDFLRDTTGLSQSVANLPPEVAVQKINSLNQNRLFKNTYRDVMPMLSKLSKAVFEYTTSKSPEEIKSVSVIDHPKLQPQYAEKVHNEPLSPKSPSIQQDSCQNKDTVKKPSVFIPVYVNPNTPSQKGYKGKIIDIRVQKSSSKSQGEKASDDISHSSTNRFICDEKSTGTVNLSTMDDHVKNDKESHITSKEVDAFNAINKCKIYMDGLIISEETLMKSYLSFLSEASKKRSHNVGFALHTGSVIFDALSVFWAVVLCFIANSAEAIEIVRALNKGDLVIYTGHGRYRFEGIETIKNTEYAVLRKDDKSNSCRKLPSSMWNMILPYLGDATTLCDQEIKQSSIIRNRFFTKILGIPEKEIPSVFNTSIVFVMPKEKADRIVKGLTISFYGDNIDLLDLVTASYFTDNSEIRYRGNAGRNEPVLKFTAKVSTGRKLILQKHGNTHFGLFVCDDEIIRKSQTELPELLNRKSIPCIFTTACIDSESAFELLETQEDATAFACTKDFLLSTLLTIQEKNDYTKELFASIDSIIDHEVSYQLVDGFIDWSTYKEFRKNLFSIRNSDYKSNELDDFIINSWTLFNLFQTMPFSMKALERLIVDGSIPTALPIDRINKLKELEIQFPEIIKEKTGAIIQLLISCYLELKDETLSYRHKASALEKTIFDNVRKKICIVVPKAYYEKALNQSRAIQWVRTLGQVTIVTANRFNNSLHFDIIICTGDFKGSRFDCFKCMSAPHIITLLYGFERNTWISRRKKATSAIRLVNERSYTTVFEEHEEETVYDENEAEDEVIEIVEQTDDTEIYIGRLQAKLPELQTYTRSSAAATKETDIAAVVTFDTGEKAFLTPYYDACVFSEEEGSVKEVHINEHDLNEGDYVVFTRNDNMMHDIVDDILTMLIDSGKLSEEEIADYKRSKAWKNKLRTYKKLTHEKSKDIAERMQRNGAPVTEQTVRIWTDPEAHTVGPKKVEAISAIGKIVFDNEMENHPEITMNSCRRIRQRRRKILSIIGSTIVDMLSGRIMSSNDPSEKEIQERIRTQADIMKIESFVRVSNKIPNAFVNRPVSL